MILDFISSLLSMLIFVTIILWLPSIIIRSLPKNKKYGNLILVLTELNRGIKKVWSYGFLGLGIIIRALISAFVGINIKPIIYTLNSPLGEGYALWASYAVAGITFYLLPNFFQKVNRNNNNLQEIKNE